MRAPEWNGVIAECIKRDTEKNKIKHTNCVCVEGESQSKNKIEQEIDEVEGNTNEVCRSTRACARQCHMRRANNRTHTQMIACTQAVYKLSGIWHNGVAYLLLCAQ